MTRTDSKDTSSPILHICLVGPSGVGKSPLAPLFKLQGVEPFRIRIPRNEKDKLVYQPDKILGDAARELLLARETLLEAMEKQAPQQASVLHNSGSIKTVAEVLETTDIV
jgi:hypothetical protein